MNKVLRALNGAFSYAARRSAASMEATRLAHLALISGGVADVKPVVGLSSVAFDVRWHDRPTPSALRVFAGVNVRKVAHAGSPTTRQYTHPSLVGIQRRGR